MSSQTWAEILAPLLGVLLTIVYRLVDRFIPDETGNHPLPTTAAAAYENERALTMSETIPTPDNTPDEDTQPAPVVDDPATDPDARPEQDSGRTLTDDGDAAQFDDTEPEESDDEHDPEERGV
jgi:hypothetical protein